MLPSMGVTWIPTPLGYGGYVPISACTGTVIDRDCSISLGVMMKPCRFTARPNPN
jgi:hypothetical protein